MSSHGTGTVRLVYRLRLEQRPGVLEVLAETPFRKLDDGNI